MHLHVHCSFRYFPSFLISTWSCIAMKALLQLRRLNVYFPRRMYYVFIIAMFLSTKTAKFKKWYGLLEFKWSTYIYLTLRENEVISQMYALNALNFHPASSLIGGRSMMLEVVTALLFSNGSISGNLGICNLGMLTLCKCIIVHC